MTLIVGILCKDGVAVAADSAATYGALGQPTISQLTKKITIVDKSVIVACSGAIGLSQRFVEDITQLWRGNAFSGSTPVAAGTKIGAKLKEHIVPEMNVAQFARNVVGQSAISNATCLTITALPVSKAPTLIQFTEIGSPEVASANLPFVSIGGGQLTADPFLAFLRNLFWPDREPLLADGIFTALWTLKHAIAHTPGGLALPIDIAVLEKQGSSWSARMLSTEELQEHEQNIHSAEEALVNFKAPKAEKLEPPPLPS
jgi:20S proteasome alpha/beta subunit